MPIIDDIERIGGAFVLSSPDLFSDCTCFSHLLQGRVLDQEWREQIAL
jgi:hypothetical protein